ncbi:zinc ribbon domain-containing protein [Exiguobacterium flavidum]|uniref:zinc ribbon domain-containing protein n=1 Tax=Exiguobacterium flavidum TaxID=2184695 RepID=UPI000DF725DB|nr:zinc ribbon domain-containing protein [Exiguobacterium flavidum]
MKYCPTCGTPHTSKDQYCAIDGTRLDQTVRPVRFEQAAQYCVACGHQQNASASYCPSCGHSRMIAASAEAGRFERIARETIRPGDVRDKWKNKDWNGLLGGMKQGVSAFFAQTDFSRSNPNFTVGLTTGLSFIGVLLLTLLLGLSLTGGNTYTEDLAEWQLRYGEEAGFIGRLAFAAFCALAGFTLSMNDEIKSTLSAEAMRYANADEVAFVRKAVSQADLSLQAGHYLLSIVGIGLLLLAAWFLEKGGVSGRKATSWNDRFERILAFTATVLLFVLLAGLLAADFGVVDIHLFGGLFRTLLILGISLPALALLFAMPRHGVLKAMRLGVATGVSLYGLTLFLTGVTLLATFHQMEEDGIDVPAEEQVTFILFNTASPLYTVTQGGYIEIKSTAMNAEYKMKLALYGEDRLGDMQKPIEEAVESSSDALAPYDLMQLAENGGLLALDDKVTRYDETVDMTLLGRIAEIVDKEDYAEDYEIEDLLQTRVAPYGLLFLLLFCALHLVHGVRYLKNWREAAAYGGVLAAVGLFVAFFTHTSLDLTWDGEVLGGIAVTALSLTNVGLMFAFAFLPAAGGAYLWRLKD